MATAESSPSVPSNPAKVSLAGMLFTAVLAGVFGGGGAAGAVTYLAKHGSVAGNASSAVKDAPKKEDVLATHPKALEPMLINLADDGGHAFLRVGVVLAEEDDPKAKKEESKPLPGTDAAARDTIFEVLGHETSEELLASDGKEKLKSSLMTALTAKNPELKVRAVYFTDFLVQR